MFAFFPIAEVQMPNICIVPYSLMSFMIHSICWVFFCFRFGCSILTCQFLYGFFYVLFILLTLVSCKIDVLIHEQVCLCVCVVCVCVYDFDANSFFCVIFGFSFYWLLSFFEFNFFLCVLIFCLVHVITHRGPSTFPSPPSFWLALNLRKERIESMAKRK